MLLTICVCVWGGGVARHFSHTRLVLLTPSLIDGLEMTTIIELYVLYSILKNAF